MDKINIGKNGFVNPMPVTLLGTMDKGKPNFMPLAWVSRANLSPPMVMAAINKNNHSRALILDTKTFSLNMPTLEMVEAVDYCGLVSRKKVDKSAIFEVFYGELKNAPLIRKCPLCIECKSVSDVDLPTNTIFIGEVVATYTEEKYLTDAKPDIKKINPLVLSMPDNRYWGIGQEIGKAWSIGKTFKKD